MPTCCFASDLHGRHDRYRKLFRVLGEDPPRALFLGGDLLPLAYGRPPAAAELPPDFFRDYLAPECRRLRRDLGERYPRILLILGNDDPRVEETPIAEGEAEGLWTYLHGRHRSFDGYDLYGYACVPPTPFRLKDWERYDVGRYTPHGCISPEEGTRSVPVESREVRFGTIARDLDALAGDADLSRAVLLFHTPPYQTHLDRAALDGKAIDHAPLDVHVGSVAVRRFIEAREPLLTLHGHVHESARLTGSWRDRIGATHCLGAAHDGPELALVRFDPADPGRATRDLL